MGKKIIIFKISEGSFETAFPFRIRLSDDTSASDRGAIGSVTASINYENNGLQVSHLQNLIFA